MNINLERNYLSCVFFVAVLGLAGGYNVEDSKVGISTGQTDTQFGYTVAIATPRNGNTV